MVTSRGAFFLSLSLIICVAMLIYGPQIGKFRYLTVPTNQGLFILDTKTQMMNVCTDKNCRIVPHEVQGNVVPGMQPTYGQMQMAPVSSLGVIENTNIPGGFSCGNGVCVMPMPMQQQPQMMPAQPKAVAAAPIVTEEQHPVAQEMVAPEPVRPQPIAVAAPERFEQRPVPQPQPLMRPAPPAVQAPIPQQMPLRPQPAPMIQQRNLAEEQVLRDEQNLQTTEQVLGLGR